MDLANISKRLEARFGVGTRPDLRRRLYQRLEDLVMEHGEPAAIVIATAAADASGKNSPGHYFARVVMLRLMERGVVPAPEL